MKKLLAVVMILALSAAWAQQSLLDEVRSRGSLVCGTNNVLPGFGFVDEAGNFQGFDVDFCRAIAAAVLGDANAVEFRPLTPQERFTALQTREVDVLIRNTTWTSSRDTTVGLNFAPVTFFDGQGFMTRRNAGITTLEDFEGRSICVQSGTTTELNLADTMRAIDVEYTPIIFETQDQITAAYDDGACDGWTTDRSGLIATQTQLRNPAEHVVLDVTISKEPLAPSVLHGDDAWYDAVKWVVFGLMEAEEYGVTSENVEELAATTEDPAIQRLLGVDSDHVAAIGLLPDGILQAVLQVGNYGEIYDRNLGPDTQFDLPRGLNALYTEGGLIYGMPFR